MPTDAPRAVDARTGIDLVAQVPAVVVMVLVVDVVRTATGDLPDLGFS